MDAPLNKTKAWKNLEKLRKNFQLDLKLIFENNSQRAEKFSVVTENLIFDYSRQLIDEKILAAILELATETELKQKIAAMFSGEKINVTENRPVLHTALRNFSGEPIFVDSRDVMPDVRSVLEKIKKFSEEVLAGERTGLTGKKFKNIVALGIGGSCLGPEYLAEACQPYARPEMKLVFVANIDVTDFVRKTADLNPEETLVVVVSKTFTTSETMKNAATARRWLEKALGENPEAIKRHFIAVSAAADRVSQFGLDPENMFVFWDWVGGRFSASSAVGALPLSLFLGFENFQKILEGAFWLDQHFLSAPFKKNIPVLAGLLDIWNINFLGYNCRAILPYSQALWKYAAHCQQVEMESNGKSVDLEGRAVVFDTGEIVFGEPGTNGQHSFYQLLHQGTQIIPADFIGFIEPQYRLDEKGLSHHEELITNFLAQPDALAFGQDNVNPHKKFKGNRPSNIFLLKGQDPFSAGLLLALAEHRVAVKGFVWGINSFDQFGVELGKVLAQDLRQRIEKFKTHPNDPKVFEGLNSSTRNLLKIFLSKKL